MVLQTRGSSGEMRCAMDKSIVQNGEAVFTEEDFRPAPKERGRKDDFRSRNSFYGIKYLLKENRLASVCIAALLLILLSAILAPLSPYDPDALDIQNALQGPGPGHLLGTDDLGRDTLTRALYGGRVSLAVGFAAMAVSVLAGTLLGTVSGYVGGKTDTVLMRIVDIFLSIPNLLFIIVIYAFVQPSLTVLVLMLAFFSWTGVARVVRAETLSLKQRDFVIAAKCLGVSDVKIIMRHIIPNMSSQIIVSASISIARAILDESALSFLGYGVRLPMSSWGSMLQNAQKYILHEPLLAVVPGVLILVTVLCFNILGDMLQHALDPKLTK